jgi:hypothetical protein
MTNRLKLPLWLFPLVIAALVALFGWWGNVRLRETVKQELQAQLTTTLNANVTALEIWTTNQLKLASILATDPTVRSLGAKILEQVPSNNRFQPPIPEADQFTSYLRPRLSLMGYETAQLVNTNFAVMASSERNRMPVGMPISDSHTNKFSVLFISEHPVVITPFKPELFNQRRALRFGSGPGSFGPGPGPGPGSFGQRPQGTNADFRSTNRLPPPNRGGWGRRGDVTLMQVAAPLRNAADMVCGALALIINPDNEFSKMLSMARQGESGETYAFDQTGLLISHSRFDDQLRQFGLLAATNASSTLNLRLHDPGGDLTQGYKLTETGDANRPLIHLVDEAVDGVDGVDLAPTRDYRGVLVVGAWRWLPQLGFGVATQIDAAEAYRPLHVLQWLFISLCLLLVLCAVGMFVFSYASVISRRRMNEAELRLKQLGQYKLEEKIGAGGMGVVYRARHALMRRETAVKLLLPDRADPAAIERFEREVRLTCQLTHPNTIQVYDYGHTPDGIFYYAMEYLRGLNLHDLTVRFGCLPEGRVIHILIQVCDSLTEAHNLGLIHRDIKPGNIFVCPRGGIPDCVKVLDFGLVREYRARKGEQSKLTNKDTIEGTPWFMPPEAFKGSTNIDPRSDLYSVGALGYYLLTGGQYVFAGESLQEINQRQLAEKPVPPSARTNNAISPELDQIILSCLEIDPDQRPQSAGELREWLLACPRAGDWKLKDRMAWWTKYRSQPPAQPVASETSTPMATVSVDIADRIPPET